MECICETAILLLPGPQAPWEAGCAAARGRPHGPKVWLGALTGGQFWASLLVGVSGPLLPCCGQGAWGKGSYYWPPSCGHRERFRMGRGPALAEGPMGLGSRCPGPFKSGFYFSKLR